MSALVRSFNRGLHRLHRGLGSALCLLLATWFASGAVMTFARYPSYQDRERLWDAEPLSAIDAELPAALRNFIDEGGLSRGKRIRLAQLEGEPTWLWTAADGARMAQRARAPFAPLLLTEERVVREVMRRRHARAKVQEVLDSYDQWTVAAYFRGFLPLSRVQVDDGAGTEVYVSLRSGEIVQASTQWERVLSWLGPIPHWIYPAALRARATAWRTTVLALATLGIALTLSGLFVGMRMARARSRRGLAPAHGFALRWHQRLGLGFGALVLTWLASGALSLSPFGLNRGPYPDEADLRRVHGSKGTADTSLIAAALEQCRRELVPHELELVQLGARLVAVCSDRAANTQIIDLADKTLTPRGELPEDSVRELLHALSVQGQGAIGVQRAADAYYYRTHADSSLPLPVATFDDEHGTRFYFDAARAELRAKHDRASRRDRWLYNGFHSFDWPLLYAQRTVWRTVVLLAMVLGCSLSLLGFAMFARRRMKRLRRRERREHELGSTAPRATRLTPD